MRTDETARQQANRPMPEGCPPRGSGPTSGGTGAELGRNGEHVLHEEVEIFHPSTVIGDIDADGEAAMDPGR